MALPPIDMGADELEETDPSETEDDSDLDDMPEDEVDHGLDPMFANDAAEAFPDADDAQLAALQRAILGLISGGGAPPAPAAPPMGF
jgi:hypothetical protein